MDETRIPSHVGIIMDGNGRWATARGKERSYGHKAGAENVDRIVTHAFSRGVKTLSLYAFSAENWARPKAEVDELMRLIKLYFKKFISKAVGNGVRLFVMGDLEKLSPSLRKIIADDMRKSEHCTSHILNIGINYGGRQEIVYAVKTALKKDEEITEKSISENLYTAPFGEPDLIIRTGGEKRLSGFMPYQSTYSELYFCDTLFPDFGEKDISAALSDYSGRNRRFGKI